MSIFSWVYKPYTFWNPFPLTKDFLSAKNPLENNKKSGEKVKSLQNKCGFSQIPHPPKSVWFVHSENVDIYGRPLTYLVLVMN